MCVIVKGSAEFECNLQLQANLCILKNFRFCDAPSPVIDIALNPAHCREEAPHSQNVLRPGSGYIKQLTYWVFQFTKDWLFINLYNILYLIVHVTI